MERSRDCASGKTTRYRGLATPTGDLSGAERERAGQRRRGQPARASATPPRADPRVPRPLPPGRRSRAPVPPQAPIRTAGGSGPPPRRWHAGRAAAPRPVSRCVPATATAVQVRRHRPPRAAVRPRARRAERRHPAPPGCGARRRDDGQPESPPGRGPQAPQRAALASGDRQWPPAALIAPRAAASSSGRPAQAPPSNRERG